MELTIPAPEGRRCGEREEGEPYACCGMSSSGMPIEFFIVDPVIPFDWQRGAEILPRDPNDPTSVNDLVVYVGADNYPMAWDFVEEARLFGVSRRMSETVEFEKLTPGPGGSRMVFVHRFARPNFDYRLMPRRRPLYGCKQAPPRQDWKGFDNWGWHPDGTACTHALRNLAWLFHGGDEFEPFEIDDEYDHRLHFASTKYVSRFPEFPRPCGYYKGCLDREFNRPRCGLCPEMEHKFATENLGDMVVGQSLTSDKAWTCGIFLALPLTHFEGRGEMKAEVKERLQKSGYEVADGLEW